jgi:hypothetical protein
LAGWLRSLAQARFLGVVLGGQSGPAGDEAKHGLPVSRVARQIGIARRVPEDEVVRVTLHDKDGTVLFEGDVR